jgi:hypothetical protein
MAAVILCSVCKQALKGIPYRYCTAPSFPWTIYLRLGDCCNTPERIAKLQSTGWTIGDLWRKPETPSTT